MKRNNEGEKMDPKNYPFNYAVFWADSQIESPNFATYRDAESHVRERFPLAVFDGEWDSATHEKSFWENPTQARADDPYESRAGFIERRRDAYEAALIERDTSKAVALHFTTPAPALSESDESDDFPTCPSCGGEVHNTFTNDPTKFTCEECGTIFRCDDE